MISICGRRDTPKEVSLRLFCYREHIFDENTITGGGVVDKNMGDRIYQFFVLDDGGASGRGR